MAAQSNAVYSLSFFLRNSALLVDSRDKSQSTPLHWACQSLSYEVVRYLLAWGANIDAVDDRGYTPLHLVVKNAMNDPLSAIDIVRQLIEAGANTSIYDNSEQIPLHYVDLIID